MVHPTILTHTADNGQGWTEDTKYRLGPLLRFDAEKERFIDAPEADKLLTREYRKPFVVPEEV